MSKLDFDIIATSYMPQLSKKLGALKGSIKKVEQGIQQILLFESLTLIL